MLQKFKVRYFAGFDREITLDLSNPKNYEFNTQCISEDGTIRAAVVHGINGVGKSNLGLALFDIFKNLTDYTVDSFVRRPPYLCANRPEGIETADFEYTFRLAGCTVVYSYSKHALNDIVRERLSVDGKMVIDFDRSGGNTTFSTLLKGTESLNTTLTSTSVSVLKFIKSNTERPDTPHNRAFNALFEFVERMLCYKSLDYRFFISAPPRRNNLMLEIIEADAVKEFEEFLLKAGVTTHLEVSGEGEQRQIVNVYNRESIPLTSVMSTGTDALMLFFCWLLRIRRVGVSLLFIDEFDAFYYFKLSRHIIEMLRDIPGLQFILTTHNPATISNSLLRPDCYFIMDKAGIISMAYRTPKELRAAHNTEKMYKADAFNCE